MKTIRKTLSVVVGTLFLFAAGASAGEPASQPAGAGSSDWPQWRGPTRDGIAAPGPKLMDAWPKDGPKLLWKSDPMPVPGVEGGMSSPVVAGGKVFVFVPLQRPKGGRFVITPEVLRERGWVEGVPDDLAKNIEAARLDPKRKGLSGKELDAYINSFTASLDPALAGKFADHIQFRLKQKPIKPDAEVPTWKQLCSMAALRGREFVDALALGGAGEGHPGQSFVLANSELKDILICLDEATGKELWRKELPSVMTMMGIIGYCGPSDTPAIAGDRCYFQGSMAMYCLSVKDGSMIWQSTFDDYGEDSQGRVKLPNRHSSPLVMNGAVYVLTPSGLAAYDAKDGRLLWRQPKVRSEAYSIMPWTYAGKTYLIGRTWCIDPEKGDVLWGSNSSEWGNYSTPAISGDIMVEYAGEQTRAYKMTPGKVEKLWEHKGFGNDNRGASPLIYQDYVYVIGAQYTPHVAACFDLKTGEVKWKMRNGDDFYCTITSPVLADGKIIIDLIRRMDGTGWDEHGRLLMYQATPERMEILGLSPLSSMSYPFKEFGCSPALVNGKLYLRLKDHVACYDLAEHRTYVDGIKLEKSALILNFKNDEGGVTAQSGAIEGLVVTDAKGKVEPAKAHLNGATVSVDIKDEVFPIKVSYAESGNLVAKNGPLAPFEWKSPRLVFESYESNTLTLKFQRAVTEEGWKSEKAYTVAGAKVTGVELSPAGDRLRVATDKTWKPGETIVVRYPALSPERPALSAEASYTVAPSLPITEWSELTEFLIGGMQEDFVLQYLPTRELDAEKTFAQDILDKNIQPVPGDKWKVCKPDSAWNHLYDFKASVGDKAHALIHACVYIYSDVQCKIQIGVRGHGTAYVMNNPIQILVNGKIVNTIPRGAGKAPAELKRGWNTVLSRIPRGENWTFQMRIWDEDGLKVPTGLRYTAELPVE